MVSRAAKQLREMFRPAMTGAELARKLDVSRAAISGWLAGDYLPSPGLMRTIEDLTGIPMRDWTEPVNDEATPSDHG